MKLDTWAESNIGLVRKANQDTVGCFPELALFVIADGMGGRSEGETASRLAVETLRQSAARDRSVNPDRSSTDRPGFWRGLLGSGPVATAPPAYGPDLVDAVLLANERVYAAGQQQESTESAMRGSMGTTVVVLHCDVLAGRAVWAHVGDSRLYRVRDGEVALLTADHTQYGEEYWDAPMIPTDLQHTNRLVRALGIGPDVEVSEADADLRPHDLYLLCSDGVSGMLKPDELRRLLLAGGPIDAIGRRLIEGALEGGGRDNASAVLVRVSAE